jgi:predicted flap endonuclease-1-like 5' DNA nuclease
MTAGADHIADILKLSRPAQRALAAAGIVSFADLSKWTRKDVAALHGIGPKSLVELDPAMAVRGLGHKAP